MVFVKSRQLRFASATKLTVRNQSSGNSATKISRKGDPIYSRRSRRSTRPTSRRYRRNVRLTPCKLEVTDLRRSIAKLKSEVGKQRELVEAMAMTPNQKSQVDCEKIRVLAPKNPATLLSHFGSICPSSGVTNELLGFKVTEGFEPLISTADNRTETIKTTEPTTFAALEQETVTTLFDPIVGDNGIATRSSATTPSVHSQVVNKIRSALNNLPEGMQVLLVGRIGSMLVAPELFTQQANAITSLSLSAAKEAQSIFLKAGRIESDSKCAQLASEILEAYLHRSLPSSMQQRGLGPATDSKNGSRKRSGWLCDLQSFLRSQ